MKYERFFPKGAFKYDDHSQNHFANHLNSMDEVPIRLCDMKDPTTTIFRLLVLPTWWHPVVIRVFRQHRKIIVSTKETDCLGGFDKIGEVILNHEAEVPIELWNKFALMVRARKFWSLPTNVEQTVIDGTSLVIEGATGAKYHVIQRCSPQSYPMRTLIDSFFAISPAKQLD